MVAPCTLSRGELLCRAQAMRACCSWLGGRILGGGLCLLLLS